MLWVAGPGALLVAKIHKIAERAEVRDRLRDKDALDVLRLLRAVDTDVLSDRIHALSDDDLARPVTEEALILLPSLFGSTQSDGVQMAIRAAGAGENAATIAGSLVALAADLTTSLE